MSTQRQSLSEADVPLDREEFLLKLIREVAGTLENVVGLEDAEGYISIVGAAIGDWMNTVYRDVLATERLSRDQVADVLVDLKRRIDGDFFVIEATPDHILLGNRRCPFGDHVVGRPSLCMMTSNVFGRIAAENVGYAKVELQEAIATGAKGCRVLVLLKPNEEADAATGREYFAYDAN